MFINVHNLLSFKRLIKCWDGVSCKCNLCKKLWNNVNNLVNSLSYTQVFTISQPWIPIYFFRRILHFLCSSDFLIYMRTHTRGILWIVNIYFKLASRFRLALCMDYPSICTFFSTINELQYNTIQNNGIRSQSARCEREAVVRSFVKCGIPVPMQYPWIEAGIAKSTLKSFPGTRLLNLMMSRQLISTSLQMMFTKRMRNHQSFPPNYQILYSQFVIFSPWKVSCNSIAFY